MLWKDSAIKTLRLKLSIKTAHKIIFSENNNAASPLQRYYFQGKE